MNATLPANVSPARTRPPAPSLVVVRCHAVRPASRGCVNQPIATTNCHARPVDYFRGLFGLRDDRAAARLCAGS